MAISERKTDCMDAPAGAVLREEAGMKPELTIDINLNITDETAVLCAWLLDMYCDMRRGDFDIGYDGCNGCALASKSGYCNYRHIQAWYREDIENGKTD